MKILKRVLCLTMAVLMLLPLLVACKKSNEGEAQSGVDSSLLAAEMPDDGVGFQDYGGREIRILGWTAASANEFEVAAEDTGTTLKAAVFARNEALKARLNVGLKWDFTEGHAGCEANYVIEAGNRTSTDMVDILTPYSQVGCMLMMNGIARDLQGVPNLRITDPWWNQTVNALCAVNGKIYFAAGDISWTMLGNTIAFCFNKDILSQKSQVLDQFGVTSMYELVDTYQWTLPNMITISKAVAAKDLYGFTAYIVPMDAFYKGCNFKWMEIDPNTGNQMISEDQHSSGVNDVLRQLTDFFRTEASSERLSEDTNLDYATNNGNTSNPSNPEWMCGQSLFVLNAILSITDFKFSELGFDYGVLPMPMKDQAQRKYVTTPDFEYSLCVIPRQTSEQNLPIVGAVLQVMASEGSTRIIPKYYNEVLKKQEADSSQDYAMMDVIRASIELDAGRMFAACDPEKGSDGLTFIAFRDQLHRQSTSMSGWWESNKDSLTGRIENMIQTMQSIERRYGNA